jgi:hypothetical protein
MPANDHLSYDGTYLAQCIQQAEGVLQWLTEAQLIHRRTWVTFRDGKSQIGCGKVAAVTGETG